MNFKTPEEELLHFAAKNIEALFEVQLRTFAGEISKNNHVGVQEFVSEIESLGREYLSKFLENNQIYPKNTKYVHRISDKENIVFLELDPQVRTIPFLYEEDYIEEEVTYRLAMPYVILGVEVEKQEERYTCVNVFALVSSKPLTSIDQPLYLLPLPNIFSNGSVCMPLADSYSSLCEACDAAVSEFWGSKFTSQMDGFSKIFLQKNKLTYEKWEEKSLENPLFALELNYEHTKEMFLSTIIEKCGVPHWNKIPGVLSSLNKLKENILNNKKPRVFNYKKAAQTLSGIFSSAIKRKIRNLKRKEKTAVKKTAVKKTAVKKTAVKKTAVKKTAVKKVYNRKKRR